jgi:chromodomain-helicase-DNA-binding protein 1
LSFFFLFSICYATFGHDSWSKLFQEFAKSTNNNSKDKAKGGSRKAAKAETINASRVSNGRQKESLKPESSRRSSRLNNVENHKRDSVEAEVKEEGEISDSEPEARYRQNKEDKWREWCADVIADEEDTLKRLERLQTTSVDLPKEKVWPFNL